MKGVLEADYVETAGSFMLGSTGEMLAGIKNVPSVWMGNFWISDGDIPILSMEGMTALFRLLMCIMSAIAPLLLLVIWKKLDRTAKLLFFNHLLISAVCIAELTLTNKGSAGGRLLYNVLLSSFLLTGLFFSCYVKEIRWKGVIAAGVAGVLLFSSLNVYKDGKNDGKSAVSIALEEQGLKYGFASFWNANLNTVRTGGKVRLACMEVSDTFGLLRRYLQTDGKWYEKPQDANEFFVLLTDDEMGEYRRLNNSNSYLIENAKREVDIAGTHRMLVYDMSFWDEIFDPGVRRFGPDYSGLAVEGCQKTEEGYLFSGQGSVSAAYKGYAPGEYRIKVYGAGMEAGDVQLIANDVQIELTFEDNEADGELLSCTFLLTDSYNTVSFKVNGQEGDIWKETIIEERIDPVQYFDVNSSNIKNNGICEIAEDGIILQNGGVIFGPYIDLRQGEYRVTVYGDGLENAGITATCLSGKERLALEEAEPAEDRISYTLRLDTMKSMVEIVVNNASEQSVAWRALEIECLSD